VESAEYDDMLRRLIIVAEHQRTINDDLRASIVELREFNRQQVEINADVRTTLARIEALLARLMRSSGNGREA
jgi:hypothetical protein